MVPGVTTRLLTVVLLGAGALAVGACGPAAGPGPAGPGAEATDGAPAAPAATEAGLAAAGDPAAGQAAFGTTCATCHGADGHGLPNLGKDLHANAFLAGLTDAEAVDFLKVGRPAGDPLNTTGVDMPPKGGNPALDDGDLLDIVAYVRTLD